MRSKTVTGTPAPDSRSAAISPAGPPPMMAALCVLRQLCMQFARQVADRGLLTQFARLRVASIRDAEMRADALEHLDHLGDLFLRQQIHLQIEVSAPVRAVAH